MAQPESAFGGIEGDMEGSASGAPVLGPPETLFFSGQGCHFRPMDVGWEVQPCVGWWLGIEQTEVGPRTNPVEAMVWGFRGRRRVLLAKKGETIRGVGSVHVAMDAGAECGSGEKKKGPIHVVRGLGSELPSV